MSPLDIMIKLSPAQERFLLDTRPYVKGSYHSPAVRTMRSLETKKLIVVDAETDGRSYTTTLTPIGHAVRRKLVRRR